MKDGDAVENARLFRASRHRREQSPDREYPAIKVQR